MGLRNAYGEYWRELLAAAQQAGALRADVNLSLLRMFLFGAMNWTLEWVKPGKMNAAELAQQLCDALFRGESKGGF